MTCHINIATGGHDRYSIVALHSSLSSGRQWTSLIEACGRQYPVVAPDIFGHGANTPTRDGPATLAAEAGFLSEALESIDGPIHLIGHSYGGAIAFKLATASRWSERVRSLTLIEPVLPTLLLDDPASRHLHDEFAQLGDSMRADIGSTRSSRALDRFLDFWAGSAPSQPPAGGLRERMIATIEKLASNNFASLLSEQKVAEAAATLSIPTLLICGGRSPEMTQRIVARLASIISSAKATFVPTAGHMLAVTHAALVNPDIIEHVQQADSRLHDHT
jgi:pimeloyl-ACP methyl ester carboxylesterase